MPEFSHPPNKGIPAGDDPDVVSQLALNDMWWEEEIASRSLSCEVPERWEWGPKPKDLIMTYGAEGSLYMSFRTPGRGEKSLRRFFRQREAVAK